MDPMKIFELLIGIACTFGIGLGIYFFGVYAGKKTDKPMGFWANGKIFDPKTVADVPGYIRAYGRLFRCYAVPCMLSGIFVMVSAVFSLIILLLWGVFGTWWLIRSYQKIEKQYIL